MDNEQQHTEDGGVGAERAYTSLDQAAAVSQGTDLLQLYGAHSFDCLRQAHCSSRQQQHRSREAQLPLNARQLCVWYHSIR
jgi:hypothetical protein